ncbi:MAG: hypothetical protein K6E17_09320 [Clostridiales bacterium]|nr:hypothetical protein [Clostridiales bacterium]
MKKHSIFACIILLCLLCARVSFAGAEGGKVIVSLGDSYSSGEGIEPFYGQDMDLPERVLDPDWLAHRSMECWPGMLTLPAVDGPMKDHRGENWFFAAASGAETGQLFRLSAAEIASGASAEKEKEYNRGGFSGKAMLPPQLDVFDELDAKGLKADYVTVTIGGNDIGFARVVSTSFLGMSNFLPGSTPEEQAALLVQRAYEAGGIRDKILRVFRDISSRAGSQAWIIVPGYPCILADDCGEDLFPENSSEIMNGMVRLFNAELRDIVEDCRAEGMNICFVSVEEAFAGHGAYSEDPYINPVILAPQAQDLNEFTGFSMYSMHPNQKGAAAYARCVQEMIDRLEAER